MTTKSIEIPAKNETWHRMLDEILSSRDEEAISAVQQNLSVFRRIAAAHGSGTASNSLQVPPERSKKKS